MEDYENNRDIIISEYCYNAYGQNYLKRKEKKYIYVYSYVRNGDPCSDPQITSWELTDIIETRILNP